MTYELQRGFAPPKSCSYLPEETSRLEYRYVMEMETPDYEALLARGWRRQGMCFFRPACPQCVKCRSLRVDVARFRASKSQRRCLSRNQDVRLVVRRADVSKERLALFNAYHADMHERRGWPYRESNSADYFETFLSGRFLFASEFAYYQGKTLVGLGLVDVTRDALSSIYFYHHPEWRSAGLGTLSVLRELDYARQTGRRWLYLGYWIRENASMSYKNRYEPHEVLERYVGDAEIPNWRDGPEGTREDSPENQG